jgi:hypothetical protein
MAKTETSCGHAGDFQVSPGSDNFMQNSVVAKPPDKPIPADAKPPAPAAHDFFLDPLPVPDATESNTDTAWGLWEHTLRSYEEAAQSEDATEHPDFADTVPADALFKQKKPPV